MVYAAFAEHDVIFFFTKCENRYIISSTFTEEHLEKKRLHMVHLNVQSYQMRRLY